MNSGQVYVSCKISHGAFSGERAFAIRLNSGEEYVGLAPRHYFFEAIGKPISNNDASAESGAIDGFVVARLIQNGGSTARIAIPDGRAIEVNTTEIQTQPEDANVPV